MRYSSEIKEKIRKRAYKKYLARKHWGITVGDHITDWLSAQEEILREHKLTFPEAFSEGDRI